MSDNFEQWFESEFPDADLSKHETLKGYNNLKYGWNAALSSLQGDQAAKIAELEDKLADVAKDADRYNWLCDHCVDFEEFTEGDSFTVKSLHFEYSQNLYLHQAIDAAIRQIGGAE